MASAAGSRPSRSGGRATTRESAAGSQLRTPQPGPGTANSGTSSVSSVTPLLKTRSGRGGSFGVQRLVLIELAAALVVCGWVIGPAALAAAGVIAALLLCLAFVRRRGRTLPEWLGTVLALRARRRRARGEPLLPGTEPGLAPAVECDPSLRTSSCTRGGARDQRPIGLIGDGAFLTAVLQVESDATALRAERNRRPLPVALVRDALQVDGIRLESAQIVLHTQPAPALHLPQESVAVRNYAPLQAGTGSPAVRITWIALKLDPELCAEAVAARGGGVTGARKCLARVADHLSSRLSGKGFRATVLTEDELVTAVATSACANPMVTAQAGQEEAPARRTEESGRSWRCDNRRHTTYWVRRWPRLGGGESSLPQLVSILTSVPALATTFSLTLAGGERQGVTLTGHLRVTGRGESELATARRDLERAARQSRTGLMRLDGEQLPGVLATLPLGGAR
ncbi:type VII secretion protein EccE [Streptomyces sp. SCSIO ZS0520]|uniref:type VII secretion protein EccE n=1 Tax=Streptomyces sp. SCSIO ZS0520 TaxID=2892996 RepID=UPI0021D8B106|nr:type VII secretion protein EccE [Streptomyces sp. SCSIO ZS0520]